MSKEIIILTPNGRRQKMQCTPDTSMLQVLEDVCKKQGFQPSDYDLKFHNKVLDLTTTMRFSNVPNRATLEMVEAETKREETNVTIGLLLEDGERRTADFPPNTLLYDLLMSLASIEFQCLSNPAVLYMRQEVTGIDALKEKSLRQLGLIKGKAMLRLLNKSEETRQANVSSVYRRPVETPVKNEMDTSRIAKDEGASTSPSKPTKLDKITDIVKSVKKEQIPNPEPENTETKMDVVEETPIVNTKNNTNDNLETKTESSVTSLSQSNLERRLRIEEEVTFIGDQKAIAFTQDEVIENEVEDLPDDFYDLTIEEVRRLYKDLQEQRLKLENTPLMTSTKREEIQKETSEERLAKYKNVVVRIQFPDHMILQGVFSPSDTIEKITNFVKGHLSKPEEPFHIFTTPLKETIDPKMTLLEAKLVPCVHMHFKWTNENASPVYLNSDIYHKITKSDAAHVLASKYRAPTRRKLEDSSDKTTNSPSTSKGSKVPKWFKN